MQLNIRLSTGTPIEELESGLKVLLLYLAYALFLFVFFFFPFPPSNNKVTNLCDDELKKGQQYLNSVRQEREKEHLDAHRLAYLANSIVVETVAQAYTG